MALSINVLVLCEITCVYEIGITPNFEFDFCN